LLVFFCVCVVCRSKKEVFCCKCLAYAWRVGRFKGRGGGGGGGGGGVGVLFSGHWDYHN